MEGRKPAVGLICPIPGIATEGEFHRRIPEAIEISTTRIALPITNAAGLAKLVHYAEDAADLLALAKPDVVAFCCTGGSFIKGLGYDKEVAARLQERLNGLPVITTSGACLEALKTLGAKRIGLVTPYLAGVTELERVFLEANGFEVTSVQNLNLDDPWKIAHIDNSVLSEMAARACESKPDALFLSCCALAYMDAIDSTEKRLGVPMVTSNQATLWAILDALNMRGNVPGAGILWGLKPASKI